MPLLSLSHITKRYGRVVALADVSLEIETGEVHALLGENGAGKSTLMKIAYGLERPDSGSIAIDGVPQHFSSPAEARRAGLGMVHQHFTSIPSFTVAENIALAAGWPVAPAELKRRTVELCQRVGLPLDPSLLTANLSAGLKQRLELLMALASDARVLLLDEPTSVLAPPEVESLLSLIGELRGRGIAVVLITHKLEEALRVADRVTVLRRGVVQLSANVDGLTREQLVGAMVGSADGSADDADGPWIGTDQRIGDADGAVLVRAHGLQVSRVGETGSGLRSASFTLVAGKIVGVAAVEGCGQRELFRAIAGLAALQAGSLEVTGTVSFVPEDRTTEGLIPEFTLTENLALSQRAAAPWIRGPWIDWSAAGRRTGALIEEFDVRIGSEGPGTDPPNVTMASLSGGNQQKLVIAGALERKPAVLLAENPTRGLDIRASAEVIHRLKDAARQGVGVLVHLPDLDELLRLADRIVVLNAGVLTAMPMGADRAVVGAAMVG